MKSKKTYCTSCGSLKQQVPRKFYDDQWDEKSGKKLFDLACVNPDCKYGKEVMRERCDHSTHHGLFGFWLLNHRACTKCGYTYSTSRDEDGYVGL